MHAALSTLLEVGPEVIESHILGLTQNIIDEFRDAGGARLYSPISLSERAGIVTIEPPKEVDPTAAFEKLTQRNVFISLRNGKFRYSPHFYNTIDEVQSAVALTKETFRVSAKG